MKGWPIVGWATLAVLAIVGVILAMIGADAAGIRMGIRATARTSVVFFSLAFAASALRGRWPNAATSWLMQNRRQLGVSFAVSHLIHLLLILAMAGWTWEGFVAQTPAGTRFAGGIGYVFIALMTATSFDRTAGWLGPRRWRQLHTSGAYYIWIVFGLSFFPRASKSVVYWPFAAMVAGAMALRWIAPRAPVSDVRLPRSAAWQTE